MKSSLFVTLSALAALLMTNTTAAADPLFQLQGHFLQHQFRNCGPNFVCSLTFPAVPAGSQLIVDHASCLLTVDTTVVTDLLFPQLTVRAGAGFSTTRIQYLGFSTISGTRGQAGSKTYIVNTTTLQLYRAAEQPAVVTLYVGGTPNSTAADCTISGEIKP